MELFINPFIRIYAHIRLLLLRPWDPRHLLGGVISPVFSPEAWCKPGGRGQDPPRDAAPHEEWSLFAGCPQATQQLQGPRDSPPPTGAPIETLQVNPQVLIMPVFCSDRFG